MNKEKIIEAISGLELSAKMSLVMTQLVIVGYVIPKVVNIAISQNTSQLTITLFITFVIFGQLYYMFKMLNTFENLKYIFFDRKNKNKKPIGVS